MSKKDKGWDYLNSDDVNSTFSDENDDGSWSYKNDDGSSSYYGADGSWGYTNPDGSGSYYGADGSWGYKNSDGSGSYYGADDSWGYKNSDGSASYYGSNGSWGYKNSDGSGSFYGSDDFDDSDGDDSNGNDSDISLAEGVAGLALGLGAIALAKHSANTKADKKHQIEKERIAEEKRREQERVRKEKQEVRKHNRIIRNKRLKALFFNSKKIQVNFNTEDLTGNAVDYVISRLKDCGFKNTKSVPIKDIYIGCINYVGEVEQVIINGQPSIVTGEEVPYDAEVIVTYHAKKEFAIPYSSGQFHKRDYKEVMQQLSDVGFTEICLHPLKDLTTGWIKKKDSVSSVIIDGHTDYKKNQIFAYDVEIVVQYHSFKNK